MWSMTTDWLIVPALAIIGMCAYYILNHLFAKPKPTDVVGERYLDHVRRTMNRSMDNRAPRTWE